MREVNVVQVLRGQLKEARLQVQRLETAIAALEGAGLADDGGMVSSGRRGRRRSADAADAGTASSGRQAGRRGRRKNTRAGRAGRTAAAGASATGGARKRRGRTFTAAQRKEQAERMRKYWAERRKTAK